MKDHVHDEGGDNYREIAVVMTELGYPMNYCSARNYVIRVMKKFVEAYAIEYEKVMTDDATSEIAKMPEFQNVVGDILTKIEFDRRINQ